LAGVVAHPVVRIAHQVDGAAGRVLVEATVRASTVSTAIGFPPMSSAGLSGLGTRGSAIAAKVKATSAAVSGWPSCQRMPSRSVRVRVVPRASSSQRSASAGCLSPLRGSRRSSVSKTSVTAARAAPSVAMIGLNVFGSETVAVNRCCGCAARGAGRVGTGVAASGAGPE
jgi:hypothetical protein